MPSQERNDGLAPVYTWLVLRQLDQHREQSMDNRVIKIKDLAFHKEQNGPEDRRRAAEALAVPLMNLYSALRNAGLESGMTVGQAKQMIVGVLLDGEKTVVDLAAAFGKCYRFPYEEE